MYKNYIKVAWRNILKEKTFSLINITGLALGMTIFILMYTYVQYEMSVDAFHMKKDDIYRVLVERKENDYTEKRANLGAPLAPLLLENFPGIKDAVRFTNFPGGFLKIDNNSFAVKDLLFADESVFDIFTFPLKYGDPRSSLSKPNSIVLSSEMAQKYFGGVNPLNESIQIKFGFFDDYLTFVVTGVLEKIPENSHLSINYLVSYASLNAIRGNEFLTSNWDSPTWTYLQLNEHNASFFNDNLLPEFTDKYVDKGLTESTRLLLQPLGEVYYNSLGLGAPLGKIGIKALDYTLLVVSIFILLIACINFMNLTIARSMKRFKEIGIRKVFGAYRGQIKMQFLAESIIFSFIAILFSIVMVELSLPIFNKYISFNEYVGSQLSIDYGSDLSYYFSLVIIAGVVGLLSGIYPAFWLSRHKPIDSLKSKQGNVFSSQTLKKTLIVTQFIASLLLIITTLVMIRQVDQWQNTDMGFNREQIITIPINDKSIIRKYSSLKSELVKNPFISSVTASSTIPGVTSNNQIMIKGLGREDLKAGIIYIDQDYLSTFDIGIVSGRSFSSEISSDSENAILFNEKAFEVFDRQDYSGQSMELYWKYNGQKQLFYETTPIGVVNDFSYRGNAEPIRPLLLKVDLNRLKHMLIEVKHGNDKEAVEYIEKVWKELNIVQPFSYTYLEDEITNSYSMYNKFSDVINAAAFFAIFIALMGLLGLTTFTIERSTKEIGIRRVLGASSKELIMQYSKGFIKLIAIANVLAWPITYLLLNEFLSGMVNSTSMQYSDFVFAGLLTIFATYLIVGVKLFKVSLDNPAVSLRYE